MNKIQEDLLWKNISELPYFRGFLRAVEGCFYREFAIKGPVLDLGCGDGHFSESTFKDIELFGVDPSSNMLQQAKGKEIFSNLIQSLGGNLPFPKNFFETVISNSVLEHIPDVETVISEMVRVMKSGGIFITTVPNNHFTDNLSVAKFFENIGLRGGANFYRKLFNRISRHHHTDSPERWAERLKENGLEILRMWNYFPPVSLRILEFGHLLGLPTWINKQLFGRWVLFSSKRNIYRRIIYSRILENYQKNQISENGAYTLIYARKIS